MMLLNLITIGLVIIGLISLTIILATAVLCLVNFIFKQFALTNIKNYEKTKNPEVAIILGDDSWKNIKQSILVSSYLGVPFLIKALKGKTVRTYLTPSKAQFRNIVNDKRIKIIYLVGHGHKRSFSLNGNEDGLLYLDYKGNRNKKDEVHLYHCTPSRERNQKSLIDYLVKRNNRSKCFIANKSIRLVDYIGEFYKLYKETKTRNP